MKKIGKICVFVIFGMLILNFVAAVPAGNSSVAVLEDEIEEPEETEPTIIDSHTVFLDPPEENNPPEPENTPTPDDPLLPDDPAQNENPTIFASPPPPPAPSGFNSPVTPITGTLPLLTIFIEWSDTPTDITPGFVQNQLFGPRPSLVDYMLETSYGQFTYSDIGHYTWIPAWDDPMTSGDESSRDFWHTFPDPGYDGGTFISHGLVSLENAGYNFAPLDYDNDGTIEFGIEVAYLMIDAMDPALVSNYRGGGNRGMPPLSLDGKSTSGRGCTVSENSPWITLYAHELSHEVFGTPDYYGITPQAVNWFTLMGISAIGTWSTPIGPHHLDPFYKMKLGWYSPTVVMQDGYYDIPNAETNPVAFILHEPAHGTNEYFMVENRWKGTSYDNSDNLIDPLVPPLPPADAPEDIPDEGLLIWHVDETRSWDGASTGGFPKVNLTRAWLKDEWAAFNAEDFDYYDFYDSSSPMNANWYTGANSKCGVWAVSNAGANMRAWLDVPGPGILQQLLSSSPSAIPGSAETLFVKVVNTGDATDTFSFSVVGLPSDLTAVSPGSVTLNSKETTYEEFEITPIRHWTTAPGIRTFKLRVESNSNPAVFTEIDVTFEVLPFGQPKVSIPINFAEIDPGMTATYTVEIMNEGNVLDTFSLSFTGLDFGSAYEAYPTAIQSSWISFAPAAPSAVPGATTTTILSITVPMDWAAMEDATYDFIVTATSSITPDSDSDTGQLLVHATPLSMMLYVKIELMNLISDVEALPPSDVRDGLHDKATSALHKINQSIERYLLGDDPPASNLLRTTQNKLKAFLHLLDAQRGKALTVAQADDLAAKAQKIIDDISVILSVI
jgi:M6 family metalloprotease-like protein